LSTFGLKENDNTKFDYERFASTFFSDEKRNNLRSNFGGAVKIIDSLKN